MLEEWILSKLEPLKREPLIILRDPQRMIQPGAHAVDGWAEENGYAVPFCAGNLALREIIEAVRDDAASPGDARVLLVDRSRQAARIPLFYPDLSAQAGRRCQIALSLRDFLVEQTGDTHWPHGVADRNLSRLILSHLPGTLRAHQQLRQVGGSRFTDTDLFKIVIGGVLNINPFRTLSPAEIRRLCIEGHQALSELSRALPADVMETLHQTVRGAPKPFCWLLDRDPTLVIRAFTLSAIMRQHGLEHQLLLSNLDPALHAYREIDPAFLDQALQEQLQSNPDQVAADVGDVEHFLEDDPQRLAFLLRGRLELDDPQRALNVLEHERLSPLIRGMALVSLLADLIEGKGLAFHTGVLELLDRQAGETAIPALYRPTDRWHILVDAYRQTLTVYRLSARLVRNAKEFAVTSAEALDFETFDRLWNEERLNRLDYYTSNLERTLRVGDLLPVAQNKLWPELSERWESARVTLGKTVDAVRQVQNVIDARFQELYRLRYKTWIRDEQSPMVFTHQFLSRMVGAHWDPQSERKAVVMVFDGLRVDAWDELLRPVFEERFEVIESRAGSALIPTETFLSRKAISAGCLPEAFTATRELDLLQSWLKDHLGLTLHFDAIQDSDTIASGMTVRYVSDRFEYIVFNFTDQNLHGNPQDLAFIYDTTVREIIRQDVRSVLRELPDDVMIFVTSDHGFAPVPGQTITVPERIVATRYDVKYRYVLAIDHLEGEQGKNVIEFDAHTLGIPTHSETAKDVPIHYALFPRPGYTLRRPSGPHRPDRYTHGGVSLAECMVPAVVLGPRQTDQPLLQIETVRQIGSVSEGESLEIEIVLSPTQGALSGVDRDHPLAVTLSFTRDDMPARREVYRGERTAYSVRWTPQLGEIVPEERQRGEIVLPVTVILTYRQEDKTVRLSRTATMRVKLDPSRLRRRVDSKLDMLMGKVPKGLKS